MQILYAPDFVISSGAGIAIDGLELRGWEWVKVNDRIVQSIKEVLKKFLNGLMLMELRQSKLLGISPKRGLVRLWLGKRRECEYHR